MLNALDAAVEATLRARLPDIEFRPTEARYLQEPRGRYQGKSTVLALPRSTQEVSAIVKLCVQERIGIVPYGGGTGLVGGQVCAEGPKPLVLSLEKMNRLRGIYPDENVMTLEAGMILADAQAQAAAQGRLFPLSLAAEGSAQIGGTLATNAGGTGVLRYGNARDLCLGVEAVLPSGEIYHGLQRLRKNNMGYDLRHLLIGSEGSLGIITAASLKLVPPPRHVATAVFVVPSPSAALDLLAVAREQVGDLITAFELIHRQGYEFLRESLPDVRCPFAQDPEWSVLVEIGLPEAMNPETVLTDVFEAGLQRDLVTDGLIAQSQRERDEFWSMREHIPVANKRIGAISSHDISVPLGVLDRFIEQATQRIRKKGNFRINCFGHVGDGNLHFNVFPPVGAQAADYVQMRDEIKDQVHELVHELAGSISAEHGVGRLKTDDLQRFGDPAHVQAMQSIKKALDPDGVMNPGVVLAEQK